MRLVKRGMTCYVRGMAANRSSPTRPLDPQKRLAILEAAQKVFLSQGFAGATMDHVAAEAGVGKMTVYRHFGSKEALFENMLHEVCAGRFPNAPLPESPTLRDELRALGTAFVELVTDPDRLATYRAAIGEAERFPAFARLFYEGAVMVVVDHVAGRFHARAPHLSEVEVRRLAGMFLQMVQGPTLLRLMLGMPPQSWNDDFAVQIEMAADFVEPRLRP